MLLVRLGRSSMAVNPGSRLKIFGQIENIFTSTAMLIQSASFFDFQRDTEKHAISKDIRVFFRITLKFGKKMLRIGVPKVVNTHPIRPEIFK